MLSIPAAGPARNPHYTFGERACGSGLQSLGFGFCTTRPARAPASARARRASLTTASRGASAPRQPAAREPLASAWRARARKSSPKAAIARPGPAATCPGEQPGKLDRGLLARTGKTARNEQSGKYDCGLLARTGNPVAKSNRIERVQRPGPLAATHEDQEQVLFRTACRTPNPWHYSTSVPSDHAQRRAATRGIS